ncbi:uncharacterized protein LOC141685047 [Apium graveolens]|uniref:uncharacterized protein LOC141685047 n=1 Tax=Apium graveolens TaxID=4045 RepID=UPI003D7B64BB
MGNSRAVRFLKEIVKKHRPNLVFLSEILVNKNNIEALCKSIHFAGSFTIDAQGHGGGLALLWKNVGALEIRGTYSNYIDFEVNYEQIGSWRYTGFYGCPERERCQESWNLFTDLATGSSLPWCVFGDFNDMLFEFKKKGGRPQPRRLLEGFNKTIIECGLEDLGFKGCKFTWERFRGTESWNINGLDNILGKIEYCCLKLEEWGGGTVKELSNKIKNCRGIMIRFRSRRDAYGVRKYNETREEFLKLLERQEVYWKQRSKQFWLHEGDQNTHFFTSLPQVKRITSEQNTQLLEDISAEEVKEAVFSMHAKKAPGYDGLNPAFYQAYWSIVEQDVVEFCQRFFATGELQMEFNRTLVCLIPKVKQPQQMKGRLLTDNALIAFEINHYIKRRSQGRNGVAGLKIDISKAYADLSGISLKAVESEARVMKQIIQRYEVLSGQAVNFSKSIITFSLNTSVENRNQICGVLEVQESMTPGKYLGLPMSIGRKKNEAFNFLSDRVHQKLQMWKSMSISRAGKCLLLKTAAQTIPNFWMNLLLIPNEICITIQRQMNGFWWGSGNDNKGVCWVAWEKLCDVKEAGGLGFKNLHQFKIVMLTKQGWRLLNDSNPLVTSIMKVKYFPKTDFLNEKLGDNPSYMWRRILAAQEVVKHGCRRSIGTGRDTFLWKISWLPSAENGYLTTSMNQDLENIKVCDLMEDHQRKWDVDILNDLFNSRDVQLIKNISLPTRDRKDSWLWFFDAKGEFTVKSCYRQLVGESNTSDAGFWKKLWNLDLPGKVHFFLWRTSRLCLPTGWALLNKRVNIDGKCPWCRIEEEDEKHVLFECQFVKELLILFTCMLYFVDCGLGLDLLNYLYICLYVAIFVSEIYNKVLGSNLLSTITNAYGAINKVSYCVIVNGSPFWLITQVYDDVNIRMTVMSIDVRQEFLRLLPDLGSSNSTFTRKLNGKYTLLKLRDLLAVMFYSSKLFFGETTDIHIFNDKCDNWSKSSFGPFNFLIKVPTSRVKPRFLQCFRNGDILFVSHKIKRVYWVDLENYTIKCLGRLGVFDRHAVAYSESLVFIDGMKTFYKKEDISIFL